MSKPVTTPEPKKREKAAPDKWAQAGKLGRKLEAIDADERAELEASPDAIKAKYETKRAKVLDGVDDEVRALVAKMRGEEGQVES